MNEEVRHCLGFAGVSEVKLSGGERSNYLCSHSVLRVCVLGEGLGQPQPRGGTAELVP